MDPSFIQLSPYWLVVIGSRELQKSCDPYGERIVVMENQDQGTLAC